MKNKIITLSEFEEIPFSMLEERVGKGSAHFLNKLNRLHGVELFRLSYNTVKATQFVGFVKILGYTIQVVPKIFGDDKTHNLQFLLQLLRYTKKISIKEHEMGLLSELKDDFLEIIIYLFAKNLRDLLKRDFKKAYIEFEDNTPFLKGKLLIDKQVSKNSINNTTFCCRFEQFTENNLMNQLFKYVASILIKVSNSVPNKKLLEDILIFLCDVEYVCLSSSDIERIHFTRLNSTYEPLVNLCRLILENMSVQFISSKLETFMFMFDMNRLFEEFVFEFIKKNRSRIFVNDTDQVIFVKDQIYVGTLYGEFKMRGDMLIQCCSGKRILLDTKYKVLDDEVIHGGLSQSDFYQMFAYSTSQEQKYKDIFLLYPCKETTGNDFGKRILTHSLSDKETVTLHVSTIKLTKIFDVINNRIDEKAMVNELNKAFSVSSALIHAN